jgi:hypothetical protein
MIAEPTWEGLHPRRPSDAGGSHSTFSRALPGRSLISKKATFMSTVWVSSLGTQKETLFALGALEQAGDRMPRSMEAGRRSRMINANMSHPELKEEGM